MPFPVRALLAAAILAVLPSAPALGQQSVKEISPVQGTLDLATTCPEPSQVSLERPDPTGSPTRVTVGVFVNDITKINDVEQFYVADLYLILVWRDTRLANNRRGDRFVPCRLPLDRMWVPVTETDNLRGRQKLYQDQTFINSDGIIFWLQRLVVEVSEPLHLQQFPFDRHALQLTLWPVYSSTNELVFEVSERFTGKKADLSVSGWDFGTASSQVSVETREMRKGEYSRYDFRIEASRQWKFYTWKLVVPVTLIVFMAGAVFMLPPQAFVSQVSVAVTSILTLIAFELTLANTLPRISYLTRADYFILGASALVFLALVKSVMTARLTQTGKVALVLKIDRLGVWSFPAAFLLNLAWFFF